MDKVITTYYASKQIIENPTFSLGKRYNDFGVNVNAFSRLQHEGFDVVEKDAIYRISKVLGCSIEDLMEYRMM